MSVLVIGIAIILVLLAMKYQRQQLMVQPGQSTDSKPALGLVAPTPVPTAQAVTTSTAATLRIPTSKGLFTVDVTTSPFFIGRRANCHLPLQDEQVSRQHAELRLDGGNWVILDSGSSNGVFVNQRRVSGARLQTGDVIQIGGFRLEFDQDNSTSAVEQPPSPAISGGQRFEVIKKIGGGGEGDVMLARTAQGLQVAVKVPKIQSSSDPERLIHNFQRSALLVAHLQHPHIVPILDHGTTSDGLPFLMMEYENAGTLRQRMSPGTPMAETQVATVGAQVASALGYAHCQKIIHRDVKPENVLFDSQGTAKLTDFTLARLEGTSSRTMAGLVLGTPHYMSPEQVRGENKLTPACDSYGLGVMLYEMCTGRCPFEGDTMTVMAGHVEQTPRPPRELNAQLSPTLQDMTLLMLHKVPKQRPSMQEVYQQLILK